MDHEAAGIAVAGIVFLLFALLVLGLLLGGFFLLWKGRRLGWAGVASGLCLGLVPLLWFGGAVLETVTHREYWGPPALRILEPIGDDGGRLRAIASVEDVDGDRCDDIASLVTAFEESSTVHELVIFSGGSGRRIVDESFETVFPSRWVSLAGAGDIDRDGVPDLVLGSRSAWGNRDAPPDQVQIRSGRDGALIRNWFLSFAPGDSSLTVAGAGDTDGDGFDDVLVGSEYSSGSGVVQLRSGRDGSLLESLSGETEDAHFGTAIRALGDVDGDKHGDFAVGSCMFGDSPGLVQAFSGRDRSEIWRVVGPTADSSIGVHLELVQDRDGDGLRELLVGGMNSSLIASARTGEILHAFTDSWVIDLLEDRDGDGRSEVLRLVWGGESKFYEHPIYSRLEVIGSQADALLAEYSFPGPPIFGGDRAVTAFGEESDSFAVLRGDRILQFAESPIPSR